MIIASEFNKLPWPKRLEIKYFVVFKNGETAQLIEGKRGQWFYPTGPNGKILDIQKNGPILLYVYVKPKKGI
jgi:hypothetical protein